VFYESLKTNRGFFQYAWSLPLNALQRRRQSCARHVLDGDQRNVLTRLQFKGRSFLWATIMLSLFLPGINALIPQ
jgi:hypothetical protein